MKTPHVFLLALTSVLLPACINRHNHNGSLANDSVINIKIPVLKDTIIRVSDFCSKVEFIPLELTMHSVIGDIYDLSITNQGDYVVYDQRTEKLLRFGNDGRFINQIGLKGHQSNEYSIITDYAYDPYDDQIIIWDGPNHVLQFFTLDGELVQRSEISSMLSFDGCFDILDKDHSVFHIIQYPNNQTKAEFASYYYVTSKDGTKIKKQFKDPGVICMSSSLLPHDLSIVEKNLIYGRAFFSPDIYKITMDSCNPYYHLVFADKTISKIGKSYDELSFSKMINDHKLAYCSSFFETNHYYLIRIGKGPIHLFVQERVENGKCYSGFVLVNDLFGERILDMPWWMPGGSGPLFARGNLCYFVLDPTRISSDRIREMRGKCLSSGCDSEMSSQLLAMLEEYEQMIANDNPILVKCTLR